jgi:1-acyl-sn-glycerol-3-phosphate acyltransferase
MTPRSKLALVYPRRRAIRTVLRAGIAAAFSVLMDLKIEGKENLPKSGPLIVVGNHFAFLDPVAMIHSTSYPLEFLGGLRTPNAPAWTDVFRILWGTILVRRGSSSRDALLAAQGVLEQNGVIAVFPEGGSWASVLRPPRPGTALLAAKTPSRIVPVGLDGLLDVFPAARKGKRGRVTVRIGEPFGPLEKDPKITLRQHMDNIGHEMMRHIAALIPPERRGFYSDDPAIRAAAVGTEIYPWETVAEA